MIKTLLVSVIVAICAHLSVAADATQPKPKTIAFVCERGVAKSVIAAQLFNRMAKERGINYAAVSRGIKCETTLNPAAAAGLQSDGFDVSGFRAHDLKAADNDNSEKVILIDLEKPPAFLNQGKILNWAGVPSVNKDYAAARDDMAQRIAKLVAELSKQRSRD